MKQVNKKNLQEWFSDLEYPILWSLEMRDVLDDLKDTFGLEYPKVKKENK